MKFQVFSPGAVDDDDRCSNYVSRARSAAASRGAQQSTNPHRAAAAGALITWCNLCAFSVLRAHFLAAHVLELQRCTRSPQQQQQRACALFVPSASFIKYTDLGPPFFSGPFTWPEWTSFSTTPCYASWFFNCPAIFVRFGWSFRYFVITRGYLLRLIEVV